MFGLSVESANSAANWTYLLAGGFAIACTAVALAASFVMWRTSEAISADKDRQLARFQSEAKEHTAALEKEAAKANEQAALANKAAEEERRERLKLELKLAPRNLTEHDAQQLASGAAALSGIEIDFVVYEYLGADVAPFAHQIVAALELGGAKPIIFTPLPGSGWARGVLVSVAEEAPKEIFEAADVLVTALTSVGIAAGRWHNFPPEQPIAGAFNGPAGKSPDHKIRVFVGSKP